MNDRIQSVRETDEKITAGRNWNERKKGKREEKKNKKFGGQKIDPIHHMTSK